MKKKNNTFKVMMSLILALAIVLLPMDTLALVGAVGGATPDEAAAQKAELSETGAGEPYYIQSASDWDAFAEIVSNGEDSFEGRTVLLDADIEVSSSAGTHVHKNNFDYDGNPFKGTFDGQGHTLTVNIGGGRCAAPFPNACDAAFKNLRVEGSVTGSSAHASGLVGSTKGTVTFQNIVVAANVTSSHCAGFVGHNYVSSLSFDNCVFCGTLNASSQGCGFVGWGQSDSNYPGTITFTNCAAVGRLNGNGNYNPLGCTIDDSYINVQVNNCVYNIAKKGSGNSKFDGGSADQYRQVVAGIRTGEPTVENITENTVYYPTLNDALANWSDGTTLILFADQTISASIDVSSGELKLDLNGYVLKRTGGTGDNNGHVIKVTSGGNLTVTGPGKVTGGNGWSGGGIYVIDDSSLILDNCEVSGNTGHYGGGLYLNRGAVTIKEGTVVKENSASDGFGGSGIYAEGGGTLILEDSAFTNNEIKNNNQYAVFLCGNANAKISGAPVIYDNTYGSVQHNLYLFQAGDQHSYVLINGSLTEGAKLGVGQMNDVGEFTRGWKENMGDADPANFFTGDNTNYEVFLNKNGEAEIGTESHEHDDLSFKKWTSTASLPTSAGNYYLSADVTIGSRWNVPSGTTNLDLNGHGITRTNASDTTGSVIQVGSGATLNLFDCGTETRYYTVANPSVNGAGLGTITDESTYNSADENARGTFKGGYITGGVISGAADGNHLIGGGVNVDCGSFTMNGGTIIGNKTCINAGGVKVKGAGASFTMNGGAILANYNDCYGGGISVGDNSGSRLCTVAVNGGTIARNWSGRNAGAIHLDGYKHTLSITGGSIVNNYTNGYYDNGSGGRAGGGLLVEGADLRISGDPVIKGNAHGDNVSNNIHYRNTTDIIALSGGLTSGADVGMYFKGLNSNSDQKMMTGAQKEDIQYLHFDIPGKGVLIYCDGSKDWLYQDGEFVELAGTHHTHEAGTVWACTTPVAEVTSGDTTTAYGDFNAAVNAWTAGSTLKLLADVTTGSTITVPSGEHTLDLNGYTLKASSSGYSVVTVGSGAGLTIDDTSGSAGRITGGSVGQNYGGGVTVDGGTLTLKGGAISGNANTYGGIGNCGGGVHVRGGGKLYMDGGEISGNTSYVGGGICADSSETTVSITGGVIKNNKTERFGSAVWAGRSSSAVFRIGGEAQIINNISTWTSDKDGEGTVNFSTIRLSGNPIVHGDWKESGTSSPNTHINLDNDGSGVQRVELEDALTNDTGTPNITVSPIYRWSELANGQTFVFTKNWSTHMGAAHPADYFKVDDSVSGVRVIRKDGEAALTGSSDPGDLYITFDANGGEGTMEPQLATVASPKLNENTFTREGYDFAGWNTEKDGSGVSYADEVSITLSGDLTLYAQWEKALFDGKGTEDKPYLIQSAEDWDALSSYINSGGTRYSGKHFKLTNDISVTTALGNRPNTSTDSEDNVFCGVFDGDGHTLNVNINDPVFAAPFAIAHNSTIKNLRVTGTVHSDANHATGLVAASKGRSVNDPSSLTIQNVTVSVDVSCNSHIAGVVGHAHSANITMENVVFDGSLSASSVQGGMIGWGGLGNGKTYSASFKDCLFTGSYRSGAAFYPVAFANGQGAVTLINDFYTNSLGSGGSPITPTGDGQVKLLAASVEKDGKVKYFADVASASGSSSWTEGSTLRLMDDVTVSSTITVPSGEHTIDLNGHKLDAGYTCRVFAVPSGATLRINDEDNSGVITGGTCTGLDVANAGSAVRVEQGGCLKLCGGTITGNNSVSVFSQGSVIMTGGAIKNTKVNPAVNSVAAWGVEINGSSDSSFLMSGGEISGNVVGINISVGTATLTGGTIRDNNGLYGGVFFNSADAKLKLSGNPIIKDNYAKNNKPANVWPYFGNMITIDGELTNTEPIGVTMGSDGSGAGVFTSGWSTKMGSADPADYFVSDNTDYVVSLNQGGEAQIGYPAVPDVSALGFEGDYDGEAHGIAVSAPDGAVIAYGTTEGSYTLSENPTYTDAGTYTVYYKVSQEKYTPVYGSAEVSIDQIDATVTITGNSSAVDYDGTAHKVSGYTAAADTALYDVTNDFAFSGTAATERTNAGTTNMGLEAGQFENTNGNFKKVTFNVTDGFITVNPISVTVTITGSSNTVDYDGKAHSADGYDAQADSELYDVSKDFTYNGRAEALRTNAGTTFMGLKPENFANTNGNFADVSFEVADGFVTVAPINAAVTIIGNNSTADYDGKAHSVTGYYAAADSELYDVNADFSFSGTAAAERTNAGTTDMGLKAGQFANTNSNFKTVTFNVTDGYITIKPVDAVVTITGHTGTADYNGTAQKVVGYDAEADVETYDVTKDFTFSGKAEAERTDVGTTMMGLKAEQFQNTNSNFKTVTFNVTDGSVTIDPINVTVTVTGHSAAVDYDGMSHAVSGYDAQADSDAYDVTKDFTFSGKAEAERTEAGKSLMNLDAAQFENTNANFAKVTFEVIDGYIEIDPIDVTVTITGHSSTVDYDGESHSVSGYDVEISNPLYKEADFTFGGSAEAEMTDAGTSEMGLEAEQFANTNNNFKTVVFEVTDGYVTVNPIDVTVTITGHSSTLDYDGESHSVSGYDVEIGNPLYKEADFTFSGSAEAERTDAGTSEMGLEAEQFANTNNNFKTVVFEVTDGYVTVNPISVTVTITGHTAAADYDGMSHSADGYDAQADSGLYDVTEGFTYNGRAEAVRTDAGTSYMGLKAERFENKNSNFTNVVFEVADGCITINPIDVTVTIAGHTRAFDYDGKTHTVSGYDASASSGLYDVDNDFAFSGSAEAERTDAGVTDMGLEAEQFENTNKNFANVTFEVADGYIEIKPISVTVTITGHSSTFDYDGGNHRVAGYDASASTGLYDVTKDFAFSGTAEAEKTNAGTTGMGLAAAQFKNTNGNFAEVTFDVTDGYIEVSPIDVTVTVTGHNSSADYDGKPHKITGYDAHASSELYDVDKDFSFSGKAAAERTDAGTTNMGLEASQFENKNSNFGTVTFDVTDGYVEVRPINVTVTIIGHNSTVDYDGELHKVSGYDVSFSDPLYKEADFIFSGTAEAERTDAGTAKMGLEAGQFENNNSNFATVTFGVTDGYVEIKPIDVTVTVAGHTDTVDYDGELHTVSGYDVAISNPLYTEADFTFTGKAAAERTDAGTTNMGLEAGQFGNTNSNFAEVTFDVTDGYVEVKPIDVTVTITGHTDTVDYDGKLHKVSGYDVSFSDSLYTEADFTFSGTAAAERTDAGTTNMKLEAGQFENTNGNFAAVTFEVTDGYVEVKPIDVTVTVTGHTGTVDYDGKLHKVSGYDVSVSNPLYTEADFIFSGTAEAERTDAGTTNMKLDASQFGNTNSNFATVTFDVTDGYVEVKPIGVTVTITGHTDTVDYDGNSHKVSGYDASASSELYDVNKDFGFSGTADAERTDAGTTNMKLEASQFENTNANFAEVIFNVTDGFITVSPIDVKVKITGHTGAVDYDGQVHSADGYDAQADSDLYDVTKDFTYNGRAEAVRTNAGTTYMGLEAEDFKNANGNFKTVTFEVTDGYITVNQITVTVAITGHSSSVDYDAYEHSVSGYDAAISNPLYTEADFTFSSAAEAARTDAGITYMGLEAAQFENTNPNFGTVVFEVADGYVEIKPINVTVTITGHSDTVDYDGVSHAVIGFDAAASSALYDVNNDFTFTGNASAERTEAGKTNMNLDASQFENNNTNFAEVTFDVTDGYIAVDPIDVTVTVTGHTGAADYDGKPHTVSGYDVAISNPLYKETDFEFSGKAEAERTDAGKTEMGLTAEQFVNTNANFNTVVFDVTDGYTEIKPIDVTVTVTGHTGTVDYDGKPHTVVGYDASASSSLYDVTKDFTFSGTAEAERTDAGTTNMNLSAGQFENKNANFKTVTFEVADGYLTISPIDVTVTVTGHTDTVDYDGKSHTVVGYDASASSELYDVNKDFVFSGTAEAERTDAGTTNMNLGAAQFRNTNSNFGTVTFEVTDGFLTISPIDVTVTISGHSSTVDYDGKSHKVVGYDASASSELYDVTKDFTFSGAAEAERTDAGTTNMGLEAGQFVNTNGNFKTVTFEVTDGYIEVKPIDVTVTITGHTDTVDYDGKSHSVSGYDAAVSDPLYTEADFIFSGKAEAERTDAGTTNMGLDAEQFENTNGNFANVIFDVTDGYVEVKPIDVTVTITGHTDMADYDGKSHKVSGYDAVISDPLYTEADFTFSGKAEAERTDAGTTNMNLEAEQFENTNSNFAAVTFEVTDGYIKIDPIDVTVTITGHTETVDYDGKSHKVSGYDAVISDPLYKEADFTFSGKAEAERTDAGTTNMNLEAEQFENTNGNFAAVTFEVTDGYIKIDPIDVTVTITGHTVTADYDGKAHSADGYEAEADSDLYDAANDFRCVGRAEAVRTDAGKTYMGLEAGQFENTNSNFARVTFNVTDGCIEIKPIAVTVTITGHTDTVDYDGKAHSVSGYDAAASSGLYNVNTDFTFSGTAEAERTEAGKTDMRLEARQFANTNSNFTGVIFEVTDGYIEVKPISVTVTITGHTDKVDYDGEAHSVSGYDAAISDPLYKETDFTFAGTAKASRTDAGTANMGLEAEQFVNTNGNFANVIFDVTDGCIEIDPISVTVTVTGHNSTVDYDGRPHTVSGYDASADSRLYDVTNSFTFSGKAEAERTDAGTTVMGLSSEQFTNTNPNFTGVSFSVTDGYQRVNTVNAVITAAPRAKSRLVYNGGLQELIEAGAADGGVFCYAIGSDGKTVPKDSDFKTAVPVAEKVGNYYIWYKVNADSNHNDISPACMKITLAEEEWTTVSGIVYDNNNNPVSNATVTLTIGSKSVDQIVSGSDGSYYFTAPAGVYNIVVNVGGATVTDMVDITKSTTYNIGVSDANTDSVLNVVGSDSGIVVGGLNKEADSVRSQQGVSSDKNVSVRMTVTPIPGSGTDAASAIGEYAADRNLEFYDFKVEKTVDSISSYLDKTQNVLEIVIPCSFINKQELAVYSSGSSGVYTLTESDSRESGTYRVDKNAGMVYIYTGQITTYALGYKPYYSVSSMMSLGSFKGAVSVKLTRDDGSVYELNNVSSDNVSFKGIPKGSYSMTITWTDGAENTLTTPFEIK